MLPHLVNDVDDGAAGLDVRGHHLGLLLEVRLNSHGLALLPHHQRVGVQPGGHLLVALELQGVEGVVVCVCEATGVVQRAGSALASHVARARGAALQDPLQDPPPPPVRTAEDLTGTGTTW